MKICPKCGSLSQVWVNQETRRLTCHKVGCHGSGGLDEPMDFPPTDFMKLAQSKPTNGLTVIDSQPTPLASAAMEAAREILDAQVAFFHSQGVAVSHVLYEQDLASYVTIIQKHFQPLLAKVEGERDDAIKAHGFVWNAARKAAQYFRWAGCRDTIAIEAMNQCCEAEKLTPKWSTDWTIIPKLELESLRADLAAKEAAWQLIETAPKDGTRILLWFVPNEVDMPSRSIAAIGKWVTRNWRDGNGKIVGDPFSFWEVDASLGAMSFEAVLWMPLPSALASRADKGGAR